MCRYWPTTGDGAGRRIWHLQGPLVFGSAQQTITHLRRITADTSQVPSVILNLTQPHLRFHRLCRAGLAGAADAGAGQTGVSVGLHAGFTRWGLLASGNGFPLRALLEEAVEQCEAALLALAVLCEDPVLATLIAGPGRQPPRTPI